MTNATLTPSSIGSSASASPTRDSSLNINASAKESKLAFYNVGEHEGHALVPQRRSAALPGELKYNRSSMQRLKNFMSNFVSST